MILDRIICVCDGNKRIGFKGLIVDELYSSKCEKVYKIYKINDLYNFNVDCKFYYYTEKYINTLLQTTKEDYDKVYYDRKFINDVNNSDLEVTVGKILYEQLKIYNQCDKIIKKQKDNIINNLYDINVGDKVCIVNGEYDDFDVYILNGIYNSDIECVAELLHIESSKNNKKPDLFISQTPTLTTKLYNKNSYDDLLKYIDLNNQFEKNIEKMNSLPL